MNTYTNTQSAYPTASRSRHTAKPAGRKGAIARLIVMGIFAIIGILSSFGTLPEFIAKRGFVPAVLEAFGGCGTLLMLAAWFWGMMKWIAVMGPKTFGCARSFWNGWQPLTFFGLYIKFCIWMIIALAPLMCFSMTFIPVYKLTWYFAENGIGLISALLMFAAGMGLVVLLAFWDICKLRGQAPMDVIRRKLAERKSKVQA